MAQSFDGITIVELGSGDADTVKEVITGGPVGSAEYLVIFLSARGSYAALEDRTSRVCVAWAKAGSYTGTSITFGLPPSEQTLKLAIPPICQPFTLSVTGEGRVRIDAANKQGRDGPLSPVAKPTAYSGDHDVLARVPLVALDWGMPLFSRYDVKGVALGPVPAVKEKLKDARVELNTIERSSGPTTQLRAVMKDPADPSIEVVVGGPVASAETLGWPWDVLWSAGYRQYFGKPVLAEAFEQAVTDRYGKPSRSGPGAQGKHLYWFFGLDGKQIPIDAAAPGNCLSTREHWINDVDLASFDGDLGPWGCALTMLVTYSGGGGTANGYEIHAASGYAMALNHFARRLEEIAAMRAKIEKAQAFKPKL
jgi:hypothetical protein